MAEDGLEKDDENVRETITKWTSEILERMGKDDRRRKTDDGRQKTEDR
jgi:hypothetical protein